MRNLNSNEVCLVSGADSQYVVVNTPNPNHFSSAFVAGMKGEPYSSIPAQLVYGTLLGLGFGISTGGAGFIPGVLIGALIGWAEVNSEYSHGQNYLQVQNTLKG